MSNLNLQAEQSSAASEVSLDTMSLAEYRASRDAGKSGIPAAASASSGASDDVHAGDSSLGESEAHQDGADDLEQSESGADDAAAGDKGKQQPAKKGGWQRTIDKLKRENEDLKQKLAAPAAGTPAASDQRGSDTSSGQPAQAPPAAQFATPKPAMRDYDSIEAFTDALTDWKTDKRDFEVEQRAVQARADAEKKTLLDGWNSRQAEARKAYSDYDEVLRSVSDIQLTPAHQRLLLESESGAEIAYDLASDPDELKKFIGLAPLAAARYIGKLEAARESKASASAAAPNKEPRVSNAPTPARPVSGGRSSGGATATLDLSKLTLAEYRQARDSGKLR